MREGQLKNVQKKLNLCQKNIELGATIIKIQRGQMLKFLIKGRSYEVSKQVLKQQMKTGQSCQLDKKSTIQLPSWVDSQQFQIIYNYLNLVSRLEDTSLEQRTLKINQLFIECLNQRAQNATKKMIQIMRISDYLTLERFQQTLIQQCIIKILSKQNCIIYLQQTHKKLKNSSSNTGAAQAWYTLLNSCIDFISYHLTQVYLKQPQRMQKLHEKILSEILDRTIKYQLMGNNNSKSSGSGKCLGDESKDKDREIIFNLLMKSKRVNSVDGLCNSLKVSLLNKKINKKMHAKLSWKLHDLGQIIDKKVKNFKFLDLNWILQAIRTNQQQIKVKLTLLRTQEELKGNNHGNYHIGVFYSKLYWAVDGTGERVATQTATSTTTTVTENNNNYNLAQRLSLSGQQPLTINYISFHNPSPMDIFTISRVFQSEIDHRKLELSIYCSIDQCYSFVINYIINNYNQVRLDEKKLQKEEIYALVEGCKSAGKYSQAVWLVKYLAKNQLEIPLNLLQNLPLDKLPSFQSQFIKKLISRTDNPILQQIFNKRDQTIKSIPLQHEINSLSTSKVSDNLQTKSNNSRAPSRSRHRKIFGQSPYKESSLINQGSNIVSCSSNLGVVALSQENILVNNNSNNHSQLLQLQRGKQLQLRQIIQIVDLKNYFYDKNSPILSSL